MGGWSSVLNLGGRVARFAGHNPKTFLGLTGGSVVGWNYFMNEESLLEQATDVVLGEDASQGLKDGGVVGGLKSVVFGSEGSDKSIGENVIDGVVGQGAYQQIGETAGNVVDAAGNTLHAAGQGLQQAYQGAGQMVQHYQQQAVMPPQGGGVYSSLNPFTSIGQVVSSFLGGGTGMSLAALIPAAFLMFGNFGWMGKIASLFLGSLAMKNMRMQSPQVYQPQLVQPQTVQTPVQPQQYQQALNEEEEHHATIRRGRV